MKGDVAKASKSRSAAQLPVVVPTPLEPAEDGRLSNWRVSAAALHRLREACRDPDVRDSRAQNTWLALIYDIRLLQRLRRGRIYDGPTLPIPPAEIRKIIRSLEDSHAVASIERLISSIGLAHDLLRIERPSSDLDVRTGLKALRRRKGRIQKKKAALLEEHARRIEKKLGHPLSLQDKRNLAIVLLMRCAMLRRSELSQLRREHITTSPDGSGRLVVVRSKGDQEGEGKYLYVDPRAMRAIDDWIEAARAKLAACGKPDWPDDPVHGGKALFTSLKSRNLEPNGRSIPGRDIARIVKRLCSVADLDPSMFSGHSGRRGMAVDLVNVGATLPQLMDAGRWKDAKSTAKYFEQELAGYSTVAAFFEGDQARRNGRGAELQRPNGTGRTDTN